MMWRVTNGNVSTLSGEEDARLGTHENGQVGTTLKGVRKVWEVSFDDPAYLPFCTVVREGPVAAQVGHFTILVGDTTRIRKDRPT